MDQSHPFPKSAFYVLHMENMVVSLEISKANSEMPQKSWYSQLWTITDGWSTQKVSYTFKINTDFINKLYFVKSNLAHTRVDITLYMFEMSLGNSSKENGWACGLASWGSCFTFSYTVLYGRMLLCLLHQSFNTVEWTCLSSTFCTNLREATSELPYLLQ